MIKLKLFWDLCCLKKSPADLPCSVRLLVLLLCISFCLDIVTHLLAVKIVNLETIAQATTAKNKIIYLSFSGASITVITSIVIMFSFTYIALSYKQVLSRIVQVLIGLVSIDIFITIAFIVTLSIFYYIPIMSTLGFVFVLFWQFLLYMNIFSAGLNISHLQAGGLGLLYILTQHNIGEVVLHLVVTKG